MQSLESDVRQRQPPSFTQTPEASLDYSFLFKHAPWARSWKPSWSHIAAQHPTVVLYWEVPRCECALHLLRYFKWVACLSENALGWSVSHLVFSSSRAQRDLFWITNKTHAGVDFWLFFKIIHLSLSTASLTWTQPQMCVVHCGP